MNEKLNIQNLTDELAENYNINRKDAEVFIKEFFSVIEEGLEKDKYVKIKGFGTFKLIEVDSRESVNVNTGERFEIQGHSKVTFTPDSNIKEAVNKPFSPFQTVVLAEGVNVDAPEENLIDALSDDILDEESVAEESVVEEPSPVIEETVAEEPTTVIEETVAEESVAEEPNPVIEESVAEEPTTVIEETVAEERTPVVEESAVEDQPAKVEILPIFDDEAIKTKDQPVSHQQEVMALKLSEEKRKEISKKADHSSTPYLMFLAVLTIMVCLGVVAYIYYPDLVEDDVPITPRPSYINTQKQEAESTVVAPVDATEITTASDSIAAAAEVQAQPEVLPKKEVAAPVAVREESVPKTATQSAIPVATQSQTTNKTVVNQTSQTTKPTVTIKVGNTEYIVDGEITTHVLEKGETLFALSRKYYGKNAMYICIIEYNKDVIKNPDNVPSGTRLRIPKLVKK